MATKTVGDLIVWAGLSALRLGTALGLVTLAVVWLYLGKAVARRLGPIQYSAWIVWGAILGYFGGCALSRGLAGVAVSDASATTLLEVVACPVLGALAGGILGATLIPASAALDAKPGTLFSRRPTTTPLGADPAPGDPPPAAQPEPQDLPPSTTVRVVDPGRIKRQSLLLVVFWGTALVAGFIQGRGPGGLLGSVDAHNNAPGIFTVAVGIWAMVYTVIWVNAWTLTKWTMCASREGVSLMCRRRVEWDLPWGEMACWRAEFYVEGGALRAVVFWDKGGTERRIQCYDDPDAINLTLADVVRRYAPPASEREAVRVSHSEDMPSRPGV